MSTSRCCRRTTGSRSSRCRRRRGLIYDAKGVLLADNHPSFSLEITIEKVEDLDCDHRGAGQLVPIDDKDRARFERLKRAADAVPGRADPAESDPDRGRALRRRRIPLSRRRRARRADPDLSEERAHGPCARLCRANQRKGIWPASTRATMPGPTSSARAGWRRPTRACSTDGSAISRSRSTPAAESSAPWRARPPDAGQDLHLYLDIALQQAATEALGRTARGRGGHRSAHRRRVGHGEQAELRPQSLRRGHRPDGLQGAARIRPTSRSTTAPSRGQYPPGSTIKPFIALGGLSSGVTNTRKTTYCPGSFGCPVKATASAAGAIADMAR